MQELAVAAVEEAPYLLLLKSVVSSPTDLKILPTELVSTPLLRPPLAWIQQLQQHTIRTTTAYTLHHICSTHTGWKSSYI